jgi:hypothetical protein
VALGLGLGIPTVDWFYNWPRPIYKKAAEYYARKARMATDPYDKSDAQAEADRFTEYSRRTMVPSIFPHDKSLYPILRDE